MSNLAQETKIIKQIEMEDFIVGKHHRNDPDKPDWKYKWILTWKRVDQPKGVFGPSMYPGKCLPEEHKATFEKGIQGTGK